MEGSSIAWSPAWPMAFSKEGFQQELELAKLDLAIERVLRTIDDGDGQRARVAITLKLGDDSGVFNLTLADADLEFAMVLAGITKVDVLHVGINGVEFPLLVRALNIMAG